MQDEYLGKAEFRLDRYNEEFNTEADSIRATDIAEGTAGYTEDLEMFIGKELSEEDFKKEAEK